MRSLVRCSFTCLLHPHRASAIPCASLQPLPPPPTPHPDPLPATLLYFPLSPLEVLKIKPKLVAVGPLGLGGTHMPTKCIPSGPNTYDQSSVTTNFVALRYSVWICCDVLIARCCHHRNKPRGLFCFAHITSCDLQKDSPLTPGGDMRAAASEGRWSLNRMHVEESI